MVQKYLRNVKLLFCSMIIVAAVVFSAVLRAEVLIPITVNKGTNLIKLTRTYCTYEYHWKYLAKINNLSPPYTIIAGDTLYAPIELVKTEKVVAKVASVIGGVFIVKDRKTLKRLYKGDQLIPGQTVVTEEDGFAHLIFPDNKYTRISSNSKFALTYMVRLIDKSLKAEFFLEKGRITHAVKKQLKANETFSTRTPVSVTGVRGTEYRVKMEEQGRSRVEALKGIVRVSGSGKSIRVKGGEGVVVEKGKTPQEPIKLPEIPPVLNVQDIYRELPITIQAPTGPDINTYRLRITRDLLGSDTLLEITAAPREKIKLLAIPDGKYYGFLTALDNSGFESSPAHPIEISIRTTPGPPIMKSSLGGKVIFKDKVEIGWLDQEHADEYFLQVANDKEFSGIVDERLQKDTQYIMSNLSPGTYFFRVQSIAGDGFRSLFSLMDTWKIQPSPTLDGFVGSLKDGVNLKWVTMGDDIVYDLQLSGNKEFTRIVKDVKGLRSAEYSFSESLEPGTYYVRVRGILADGQISPWTPYQILKIPQPGFGIIDAAVLGGFLGLILL